MLVAPYLRQHSPQVQQTLLVGGKLKDRELEAASDTGQQESRLFCVVDKVAGHRFLVDTGAEVRVLPASLLD